ncbi:MAG: hypothetical protein HYY06_22960 [Deltaproteobacteria bacterium]|nr:hypothetical protein [Deltaproteobacteria bacterium]
MRETWDGSHAPRGDPPTVYQDAITPGRTGAIDPPARGLLTRWRIGGTTMDGERIGAWLLCAWLVAAGCGPDRGGDDDDDDSGARLDGDAVFALALLASAPNVFAQGMTALSMARIEQDDGAGDCPTLEENGDRMVLEGGCEDEDGNEWQGRMTAVGIESEAGGTITYEGFGFASLEECGRDVLVYDGTLAGERSGDGPVEFEADLRLEGENGCTGMEMTADWDYSGVLEQSGDDADHDGEPDVGRWNGTGSVSHSEIGEVEALTTDEVVDGTACSTEAASGTTELRAGGQVAIITYDGATDCDPGSTVTWTLDGVDQGEVSGVQCSIGQPAAPGRSGWLAALWPVVLLVRKLR